MKGPVTVCACWSGDYYDSSYIDRLYNSVERNLSYPFDFVLYIGPDATNEKMSKIKSPIRAYQTFRKYWWSGMEFWAKNPPLVETDTLLYLDLDIVIVGSLDPLVEYPSDHCYMKDYPSDICPPGKEKDGNASVVLIRNGAGHQIWDEYVRVGMPQWDVLNPPPGRLFPLAAQGIMNDLYIAHDVFPEEWIPSYKLSVIRHGLSDNCIAVSFHGRPKPHECLHIPFVERNWT